ncbi:MAG TPA: 50S ribosomal protein L24 [Clostridiales bacterium]|nr:50S ribosomal protein L24 [Clostridiales bacterium]
MHVKKGDKVVVITGSDRGKIGKILTSMPKQNRVIVEGVNMVTKHQKATRDIQQAGILHQEGAITASNVMLYCDKCKSGVRTEIKIENGKKVRACKKCGSVL